MPKIEKKPYTPPTLKKLEPTDELRRLFASQDLGEVPAPVKRTKRAGG